MSEFYGPNLAYVLELYARYREDPTAVDAQTRQFFAGWTPPVSRPPADRQPLDGSQVAGTDLAAPAAEPAAQPPVAKVVGATNLAQSIREYGHLQAQLDPLGSPPPGDPSLALEAHGIDENDLRNLPASVVGGPIAESTAPPTRQSPRCVKSIRRTSAMTTTISASRRSAPGCERPPNRAAIAHQTTPTISRACSTASRRWRSLSSFCSAPSPASTASPSKGWTCSCRCWTS